jgi:hypothetical protein
MVCVVFVAFSEFDPTIIRSGFKKSLTANPSLKNSGFDTNYIKINICFFFNTSNNLFYSTYRNYTFPYNYLIISINLPISFAAFKTYDKSAEPSPSSGVGKASKII